MKRHMRILLGLVLIASAPVVAQQPASAPVLINPSFEDPEEAEDPQCDRAQGWGRWGHWINRETGWSPTRSGDCLLGYHHWQIPEKDTSGVYQDIENVAAGAAVTFSVHAFKDEGTNAEQVELRLEPAGGGPTLASKTYRMSNIAAGFWKRLDVAGRAPKPGIRVLIIVMPRAETPRGGAIKFDEAELAAN